MISISLRVTEADGRSRDFYLVNCSGICRLHLSRVYLCDEQSAGFIPGSAWGLLHAGRSQQCLCDTLTPALCRPSDNSCNICTCLCSGTRRWPLQDLLGSVRRANIDLGGTTANMFRTSTSSQKLKHHQPAETWKLKLEVKVCV